MLNAKKVSSGKSKSGSKQDAIPAGPYEVRVAQVIDLGLQAQRPYMKEEKPPANELMITYEFLELFVKDADGNDDEDKPRWLSETIPLRSLEADKAKSTQRYYALDPDEDFEGDFTQLVGVPAIANVVTNPGKGQHEGKVFNNIASLNTMLPKLAKIAPDLKNEPKVFDLDEPDMEIFGSLPDWLQDKIKDNLEFKGSVLEGKLNGTSDEEIDEDIDDEEWED